MTRRAFAITAALPSFAILLRAQAAKKTYTFHGKIESLDGPSKSMVVNGEKIEGWMGAMTMKYEVDNADVFKTAKAGDNIEATVYDGDFKLYKVHVIKK
jgi:Cu/Ag efflux protein CusF